MSIEVRWECDECGREEYIDAEEPSRVVSMYCPTGWGMSNSGWKTPYSVKCDRCPAPTGEQP